MDSVRYTESTEATRLRSSLDLQQEKFIGLITTGCSCNFHTNKILDSMELPGRNEIDGFRSPQHFIGPYCKENGISIENVEKWADVFKEKWGLLALKVVHGKELVLSQAIQNNPLLIDAFLEMQSKCICFASETADPNNTGAASGTGTLIRMELKGLLQKPDDDEKEFREAYVLDHLVKEIKDPESKNRMLSHPINKVIATLKCQRHQLVSKIDVGYHLLFAAVFTLSSFGLFQKKEYYNGGMLSKILNGILGLLALISCVKCALSFFAPKTQFIHTLVRKIAEVIVSVVAIILCVIPSLSGYPIPLISQHITKDITAYGVMVSWLVMLSHLTKFIWTAAYVETFFQIVKNFIEFFLVVAIWLFIALSASHSLIFQQDEEEFVPIANVSRSFIRAITGRMNYEDFTGDKIDFENPISIFMYFFLFLILYTVMASIIIGLATNGLEKTRAASALNVLCQAIEDVAELEWMLTRRLGRFKKWWLHKWLVRKISIQDLLTNKDEYWLEFRPHDAGDTRLPNSLKKEIYMHLMERKKTCNPNR